MTDNLYLIRCNDRFYKIGVANDVNSRLAQLQTGSPYPLFLEASYRFESALPVERVLHQRFEDKRSLGEWFHLEEEDLETFRSLCLLLKGTDTLGSVSYGVSEHDIEEAETVQEEALDRPASWDYGSMFTEGWKIEPSGNGRAGGRGKYWGWRKRKAGETGYIYGGRIEDLPHPIEDMRRIYNDD